MAKFKIKCQIGSHYTEKLIDCRELTIKDGAYCFWTGEYGTTNKLVYAFPVMYTIVEGIHENETK
jgi:hypothetical protein